MRIRTILLAASILGGLVSCGGGDGGIGGTGGGNDGGGGMDGVAGGGGGGGGGGGAGGGGGGGGVSIDQLAGKVADVYCELFKTCFGAFFDLQFRGTDCKTELGRRFEDGFVAALKKAIDEKRVIYHADKIQACLDAFKAGGCAIFGNRAPDACEAAIEGTVKTGGACTINDECEGRAFCKVDAMCPGACSALLAAGSACKGDDSCQDGLSCMRDGTGGKCKKPAGAGEACGDAPLLECNAGLLCVGEDKKAMKAGTCKASADVFSVDSGGACDPGAGLLCKSGLSCRLESASMGMPVWKCASGVSSGAACNLAFPDQCPVGEYCNGPNPGMGKFDGICAKLPTDGQACAGSFGSSGCAVGLTCDSSGASGICRKIERLGGTCTAASSCYSDRCSGGKCVPGDECGN